LGYSSSLFIFKRRRLNVDGILTALGTLMTLSPIVIDTLLPEIVTIIETQTRISALRLNSMLVSRYSRDMFDIDEYIRFPRYIEVMKSALSSSEQIDVEINPLGIYQAKFVDTDYLGNLGLLQEIQHLVYQSTGDLAGWKGIYIDWLQGTSDKYADTVNSRLDIMEDMGKAPFWELIEFGNQMYPAYPTNGAKRTLFGFVGIFNGEMISAFNRCVLLTRLLVSSAINSFRNFGIMEVVDNNNKVSVGYSWKTASGKNVVVLPETIKRLSTGRLVGKGFIYDVTGSFVRKWGGFIPK